MEATGKLIQAQAEPRPQPRPNLALTLSQTLQYPYPYPYPQPLSLTLTRQARAQAPAGGLRPWGWAQVRGGTPVRYSRGSPISSTIQVRYPSKEVT